jgi:geranylgeranyl reductase family protein
VAAPTVERCDALVVGAGPAGAAAAIALRRYRPDWRVVLLDRADFPRDKACGDAIAAHAFDELARIGVHGVEGDAPPVPDLRLRAPDGTTVLGRGGRVNRVIRRVDFDARLVTHATAAGAELHRHRLRDLQVGRDAVVVDGRWRAPWLVAADGATSVVRRRLGIPPAGDRHRAVAVRAYGPAAPGQHEQRIDMVAEGWPSYAWSFPLGDGQANVGYGMRVSALGAHGRRALLARLADAADAEPDLATVAIHPLPLSTGRPRPDHGRVLLVGDAAGLINPLTGEGIFYAVASGRMAAAALARAGPGRGGRPGPLYRRMLRRRFGRHFATTALLARLLDEPRLFPAAVTAARDPRVFADLAEIGLGEGVLTPRLARAVLRAVSGPAGP